MSIQRRIEKRISLQSFMVISIVTDVPGLTSLQGKLRVGFKFKNASIKFESGDVLTATPVFYDVTPDEDNYRVTFCLDDLRWNNVRYDELKSEERNLITHAGKVVSMPLELYHDLGGKATMFGLQDQYIMKSTVTQAWLIPFAPDVQKHIIPLVLTDAFDAFVKWAEKSAYRTTMARRNKYIQLLEDILHGKARDI